MYQETTVRSESFFNLLQKANVRIFKECLGQFVKETGVEGGQVMVVLDKRFSKME